MQDNNPSRRIASLGDKQLLVMIRDKDPQRDEAAEILTRRLTGRLTSAMKDMWPQLAAHGLSVSAAKHILLAADPIPESQRRPKPMP